MRTARRPVKSMWRLVGMPSGRPIAKHDERHCLGKVILSSPICPLYSRVLSKGLKATLPNDNRCDSLYTVPRQAMAGAFDNDVTTGFM